MSDKPRGSKTQTKGYHAVINEEQEGEELDETQREARMLNSSNQITPDGDAEAQHSAERSDLMKSDVVSHSQIIINKNSKIKY
jgi:hypothetical protein